MTTLWDKMIILKKLLHIKALLTKHEVKMAGYWHILGTKTKLREKTYYKVRGQYSAQAANQNTGFTSSCLLMQQVILFMHTSLQHKILILLLLFTSLNWWEAYRQVTDLAFFSFWGWVDQVQEMTDQACRCQNHRYPTDQQLFCLVLEIAF